jgi:hypothetical protein
MRLVNGSVKVFLGTNIGIMKRYLRFMGKENMSTGSESQEARKKFMEEYEGAKKQVFALMARFVEEYLANAPETPRPGVAKITLLEYARDKLSAVIDERAAETKPRAIPHDSRGDNVLFARLLKGHTFSPSLEMLTGAQFYSLMSGAHPDMYADRIFDFKQWRKIRDEHGIIAGSTEYKNVPMYFFYRAMLNTFVRAGVMALKADNREYSNPDKIDDAYKAGLKRLEGVRKKLALLRVD